MVIVVIITIAIMSWAIRVQMLTEVGPLWADFHHAENRPMMMILILIMAVIIRIIVIIIITLLGVPVKKRKGRAVVLFSDVDTIPARHLVRAGHRANERIVHNLDIAVEACLDQIWHAVPRPYTLESRDG